MTLPSPADVLEIVQYVQAGALPGRRQVRQGQAVLDIHV
jgi:hypothetical protein